MKNQVITLNETKVALKVVLVTLVVVISIFSIIGVSYFIGGNKEMLTLLIKYNILMLSVSTVVIGMFIGIRKLINKLF